MTRFFDLSDVVLICLGAIRNSPLGGIQQPRNAVLKALRSVAPPPGDKVFVVLYNLLIPFNASVLPSTSHDLCPKNLQKKQLMRSRIVLQRMNFPTTEFELGQYFPRYHQACQVPCTISRNSCVQTLAWLSFIRRKYVLNSVSSAKRYFRPLPAQTVAIWPHSTLFSATRPSLLAPAGSRCLWRHCTAMLTASGPYNLLGVARHSFLPFPSIAT
jgi:hypothetical protein